MTAATKGHIDDNAPKRSTGFGIAACGRGAKIGIISACCTPDRAETASNFLQNRRRQAFACSRLPGGKQNLMPRTQAMRVQVLYPEIIGWAQSCRLHDRMNRART